MGPVSHPAQGRDAQMTADVKAGKPTQKLTDKVGKFAREVRAELKKTVWPTRKELISSTGIVISSVIVISLFIALVDLGWSGLMSMLLK